MFAFCKGWKGKEDLDPAAGIPSIPALVSTFFCGEIAKGADGPEGKDREDPPQTWSWLLVPHLSEQVWPVLIENVLHEW